jgi:pyridoxal phosphate enzyme (YggS family)
MHATDTQAISEAVSAVLRDIPAGVTLVAAAKSRSAWEISAAIQAGVKIIGHNYIQEAEHMLMTSGKQAKWHFIGRLQRNKAKKAAVLFDMIETIDSMHLAETLNRHCAAMRTVMPVLIEVNSGGEANKSGVFPEQLDDLVRQISILPSLRLQGLMTMGPRFGDPEDARPYFRATKEAFDRLADMNIPGVEMRTLSMGMSNSYKVAIEEGANLIRIGSKIFGERQQCS